ncbi:putative SEC17-transport vesicle fusion protein [Tilletiaria anomala UBC 951]|uniref:Putative SEC17-transport vesicle fusion protein n=1 Tax=Tilletiaria anomala (strain ATCC 24038 / CBS 436.72 / UBC 951) TaxID=1037660 RepID=A0A066WGB3_TILAU|nr:putative SEC17-transport vesicle fusion protein [Tilletiaria anomala UBC 951]KDN53012.1 putative SEC17-transport vesicle fusion protein [Tilletiaria anomala UBC 951]
MSSADDMLRAADKKASSSGGWFSNAQSKLEEAAELYKGAGNKFRLDNRFEDAGHAFMKAAETEIKNNETDYAANTYFEASKCFKMVRPELAVVALERTVQLLVEKGRFRQAADRQKSIAELLKSDAQDPEKALTAYIKAAEWYVQEGAAATGSGCYREAAQLACELKRYPDAIEFWEKVAAMSLESNLTRYSVKDYYLNAGMCYLAIPDYVACGKAMGYYAQQDSSFPPTMEGRFLNSLLEACEAGDLPGLDQVIQDFDRTKRVQGWQASLLRGVRKGMQEEPDLS